MDDNGIPPKSIDEYILQFPLEAQEILKTLRRVIKESAPGAEEKISYQMPTFVFHGNLVYFGAFKKTHRILSNFERNRGFSTKIIGICRGEGDRAVSYRKATSL